MTIQAPTARVSFPCNSVSTVFPVNIQAYLATDFLVLVTNAAGSNTLTLNSDYTLVASGSLSPPFWSLTTQTGQLVSPYVTGNTLQVILNPAETQLSQYAQGQAFPSLAVQTNLDRLTQMAIRQSDILARAIVAPDGDVSPVMALPSATLRASKNLGFDSGGNLAVNLALASGTISTATLAPFLNLSQTSAELAAGVTPVNLTIPPLPIDPRRYGGDNTGATFSDAAWVSAIAVARKTAAPPRGAAPIYVNGTYKVLSLNFASQGSIDFNRGFTLFGDGNDSSIINIVPGVINTGIGLDMGCAAYFCVRDVQFNFGSSAANCPKVGLLLAKGNYSGTIFSGIGMFQRCIFNAWGTYNVYDYCAEQIDFNNCQCLGLTANTIPVTLSRVNTAGITSPNFVIATANDSMTEISFSGSESTISWSGNGTAVPGIFLDIGTSTGIAGIDLGTTYFPATGATSVVIADNGGAGSALQNISASNIVSEQNAGSGTQQVMVISSVTVKNFNINGYTASGVAQTAAEFVFGNPLRTSSISWHGNVVNSVGGTPVIVQAPAAVGCILRVSGNAAQAVSIGANQQTLVLAGDTITANMGTVGFSGGIGLFGNTPPGQIAGWGTPTGAGVVANFPGATATLAQTSGVVAEIIVALKQIGSFGA